MSGAFAGILDPTAREADRDRVAAALAPMPCAFVEAAGPLTVAASAGLPSAAGERSEVCLFDGYLTNLDELADNLELPRSAAPVVVVRELFVRDGAAAVGRLRGAFVAIHWDHEAGGGIVATDHLGAGGVFFWSDGRRLFFGSEIRNVLQLLKQTPGPDENSLTQWLANDVPAAGKTLYEGVSRLRGGHQIDLGRTSWTIGRYWAPHYAGSPSGTVEDHAELVGEAARVAVERRLARATTNGILLSGGLDSSSIAAFAHASGVGSSVRAYSAVFPDHPETDESELIELVAGSLRLPLTRLGVHGGSMLAPSLSYLATWRVPSMSPNLLFMTPLERAAAAAGSTVLFDGEGGDELFGASPYVFADLLLRGRVRSALSLTQRIPGLAGRRSARALRVVLREWAIKGALPHSVHHVARVVRPEHYGARWLTPVAARRHGRGADGWAWKRLKGPRWWASLAFDLTEGRERFGAHDFLRHKSVQAGLSGRHPYLEDLDLVERMLATPPEASFDATYDRPLLRRAVKGLLPDRVRLRREKSFFNSLFHQVLTSTDHEALLRLLDGRSRVGEHVQIDLIRGYLSGASDRPPSWAWIVWRVAAAEMWLRSLEDSAFAERAATEWRLEPPRLQPLDDAGGTPARPPQVPLRIGD